MKIAMVACILFVVGPMAYAQVSKNETMDVYDASICNYVTIPYNPNIATGSVYLDAYKIYNGTPKRISAWLPFERDDGCIVGKLCRYTDLLNVGEEFEVKMVVYTPRVTCDIRIGLCGLKNVRLLNAPELFKKQCLPGGKYIFIARFAIIAKDMAMVPVDINFLNGSKIVGVAEGFINLPVKGVYRDGNLISRDDYPEYFESE